MIHRPFIVVAWFLLIAGGLLVLVAQGDTVARVIDGDTVVMADGTIVRLAGIDAPELTQPHGTQSKRSLERLLLSHDVRLDPVGKDAYGRMVADVVTSDEQPNISAAATQVKRGHAWFYRKYPGTDKRLAELETTARRQVHGLWRDASAIAPWEWRKGVRPLSVFRHYSPGGQATIGDCPNGLCPVNR